MSKNTIFGEEHFIDTQMIKLVEQRNNAIDNFVFEQMENTIKGTLFVEMPKVEIDKEKLKKWVILCMKLENIEHSQLVDMATKKRIADLEAKLAEKDKEKEQFKVMYFNKCLEHEHSINKYNDKCTELELKEYDYKQTIFEKDQDKIYYAVEQLERVKEDIHYLLVFDYSLLLKVNEKIDQLITEIKEGK